MFNFIKNNNENKEINHKEIEYDVSQLNLEFKKAESELQEIKKLLKETKISADIEMNNLKIKINYYVDELDRLQEKYCEKIFANSKNGLDDVDFELDLRIIYDERKNIVKQDKVFVYNNDVFDFKDRDFEKIILRGLSKEFETIKCEMHKQNLNEHFEKFNSMVSFYVTMCDRRYFKISEQFIQTYIDEFYLLKRHVQFKTKELENRNRTIMENKKRKEIISVRNKFEKDMRKSLQNQKSYQRKLLEEYDESKKSVIENKLMIIENHISYLKEKDNYIKYQEDKIKSGYIYILSNVKSYGSDVFKVCMTNSLFPFDEINKFNKDNTPYECEVVYLNMVDDVYGIYKQVCAGFKSRLLKKINNSAGFFKCSKDEINKLIDKLNYDDFLDVKSNNK